MEFIIVRKPELERYAEDFCELYKTAFRDPMNKDVFMHRYYDNPYDDVCMCLAIDEGKVVANYSASPRRVLMGKRELVAAQSLNTVTHPDYFGRGVFVNLANMLYQDMAQRGYKFVYGFPNYISNRTFNTKLKWRTIYEVPMLTLDLANAEIAKSECGCVTEDLFVNPESYLNINNKDSEKYFEISKSPAYINWRYMENPNAKYRFVHTENGSWAILKRYGMIVNVVEMHASDIEDFNQMLRWLIEDGKRADLSSITIWAPINTKEHCLLEKYGFRNRYPIYYFGACLLDRSIREDIFDYRLWHLQMGEENEY